MPIAAVPRYLGSDFKMASPGLRFGMYLQLWGVDNQTSKALWETYDINYRVAGRDHEKRAFKDENKTACLKKACALTGNDKAILAALGQRQKALAAVCDANALLTMDAQSVAPFSTGLGNEHPLENGFAFLNPYGLPYLPGSGVKGVLRRAAEELASGEWGDAKGWTTPAIHALFGSEPEAEKLARGALSFWDVIPQIRGDHLAVDIMTPHQSHYYQNNATAGSNTPHESGSPTPISFLTVPPQSAFVFHVQCDTAFLKHLSPELAKDDHWKTLLEAAFLHAFDWLGFGAKTAVGYGAMESNAQKQRKQEIETTQARQQQQENAQEWLDAKITFNARNGSLSAEKEGKTAHAHSPEGEKLLNTLPKDIQQKIKSNQYVKVTVFVADGVIVKF
jgi:CRISPR-associated protein Cmr6